MDPLEEWVDNARSATMANVVKCDRCGKIMDHSERRLKLTIEGMTPLVEDPPDGWDYCGRSCMIEDQRNRVAEV